ncbi:uncharacterized protein N7487_011400 [Penicillium crustosum]|uniref:uncharacterized protein n=1 Tax=Penicillium crustosum TaxID=36656 RepID=UPI002382387F|nr:uncharacterized protein N7487_011400 [Penicillium crustosum]KAJ5393759.1 hypothetical protein N7487_011400 [Penicillium crustosum]
MTVAVGSKAPLILQIPQLAHRLIFSFPSTLSASPPFCSLDILDYHPFLFVPALLFLFCVCFHRSRECKLQLPVPLRRSSSTAAANKMYLVAGQRG